MINEKMIELQLMYIVGGSAAINEDGTFTINNNKYDTKKFQNRVSELISEFLEPYLIDSTSKED